MIQLGGFLESLAQVLFAIGEHTIKEEVKKGVEAWKHKYIFLKYHWNLNISEILQGVSHVK